MNLVPALRRNSLLSFAGFQLPQTHLTTRCAVDDTFNWMLVRLPKKLKAQRQMGLMHDHEEVMAGILTCHSGKRTGVNMLSLLKII